jgi:hypothetical protein
MRALGICALIIGLAALLIVGFSSVVRELLSRSVFTAPSTPNEDRAAEMQQTQGSELKQG